MLRPPLPVAAGFDRSKNVLPRETRRVLDEGEPFILLSLDPMLDLFARMPTSRSNELFHNFPVLGKTEIKSRKERVELMRALYKGIRDSHGLVAACFHPRHGIRSTLDGQTVDLLICFECASIQVKAKNAKGVLTSGSPQPTFDRALDRAGLPKAAKK